MSLRPTVTFESPPRVRTGTSPTWGSWWSTSTSVCMRTLEPPEVPDREGDGRERPPVSTIYTDSKGFRSSGRGCVPSLRPSPGRGQTLSCVLGKPKDGGNSERLLTPRASPTTSQGRSETGPSRLRDCPGVHGPRPPSWETSVGPQRLVVSLPCLPSPSGGPLPRDLLPGTTCVCRRGFLSGRETSWGPTPFVFETNRLRPRPSAGRPWFP